MRVVCTVLLFDSRVNKYYILHTTYFILQKHSSVVTSDIHVVSESKNTHYQALGIFVYKDNWKYSPFALFMLYGILNSQSDEPGAGNVWEIFMLCPLWPVLCRVIREVSSAWWK